MIRRKLQTLSALPGSDLWKVAGAWILLLAVDLGLRALSFRRLLQLLEVSPKDAGTEQKGDPFPVIRRYRRAVEIAARNHLYPMLCLRRSLALRWLLARQGVPTRLRLGVRRDEGKVAA
ncbi:MAG TPA: lasso peptide biosynthesis B2 protein, partial [Armatimonadota bacterium]|nr:lasso peptide biosynthesis B2 protein [Armatimonadota bacterium]